MPCDMSCDYIIDLQYIAGRQLFESWWNDKNTKAKTVRDVNQEMESYVH